MICLNINCMHLCISHKRQIKIQKPIMSKQFTEYIEYTIVNLLLYLYHLNIYILISHMQIFIIYMFTY